MAGLMYGGDSDWSTSGANIWRETGNVGIGVSDPDHPMEIFKDGAQLSLSYDASTNCVFSVASNGNLDIAPSGTEVSITGDLRVLDGNDVGKIVARIYDTSDDGLISGYANNVETIKLHSNGDSFFKGGSVGIGTDAPAQDLEIKNGSGWAYVRITGNAATGSVVEFFNVSTGALGDIYCDSGKNMYLRPNAAAHLMQLNAANMNMALGVADAPTDASALLQLESTTKGFLPPRMTDAQRDAIVSPTAGLMIYNADQSALQFYNGAWKQLSFVAAP